MHSVLWYNARGQVRRREHELYGLHPRDRGRALEWTLCAISLLVSVLPDELLLIIRRLGFGRRGFGKGFGSFRMLRILFALLFTTVLGPIVLVALITFIAYRFFTSRRGR